MGSAGNSTIIPLVACGAAVYCIQYTQYRILNTLQSSNGLTA